MPVARELFGQWSANRGALPPASSALPFSRDWEKLLRRTGLESAEERKEALRDAAALERLKFVFTQRPRRYQISRIRIPLPAEENWREIFADQLPALSPRLDLASVAWVSELAFVSESRVGIAPEDLLALNAFLERAAVAPEAMPVKERSLEIFGDEKRLDALRATVLFAPGRLTLERLGCFAVPEPLGWHRGPVTSEAILVVENLATYESFSRWNAVASKFAAIVYGGGNRFVDSALRLPEVFSELGGPKRVYYFGDLDAAGLRIPVRAGHSAQRAELPSVDPYLPAYRWLLQRAESLPDSAPADEPPLATDLAWLGELQVDAASALARHARLPQELVGWAFLREQL